MLRQPLTARQRGLMDFIAAFTAEHEYAPSLQEIGDAFELRSLATVHKHMVNLRERGYLTWNWNRSRTIALVPPPDCCPTCGQSLKAKDSAAA